MNRIDYTPIEEIFRKLDNHNDNDDDNNTYQENEPNPVQELNVVLKGGGPGQMFGGGEQSILEIYNSVYEASKILKYYQLDSNFNMKHLIPILNDDKQVKGIEDLIHITRYRVLIAVGSFFKIDDVMAQARKLTKGLDLG